MPVKEEEEEDKRNGDGYGDGDKKKRAAVITTWSRRDEARRAVRDGGRQL